MSKVLVDRELLEQIVNANMADYAVISYQRKEIRSALAQPAEADARRIMACVNALQHVSTEQLETGELLNVSQRMVDAERQRDQLRAEVEALRAQIAERDVEIEKWSGTAVQNGMECDRLRPDAERFRWLAHQGDACQWMNIIKVDPDDFESYAEAVDAAMAAKEAEPENVCSGCGAIGWTGNCLECIPY